MSPTIAPEGALFARCSDPEEAFAKRYMTNSGQRLASPPTRDTMQ